MTDFDRYRDTYRHNLECAIGPVGDPELLTEVKAQALLDVAGRLIGPPSELSFLDVGCGPGLTDAFLTASVGAITGVDVSAAMVERVREANPTARYEVYDGKRLPFPDGSFAVAFMICVLHYILILSRGRGLLSSNGAVTRVPAAWRTIRRRPSVPMSLRHWRWREHRGGDRNGRS